MAVSGPDIGAFLVLAIALAAFAGWQRYRLYRDMRDRDPEFP